MLGRLNGGSQRIAERQTFTGFQGAVLAIFLTPRGGGSARLRRLYRRKFLVTSRFEFLWELMPGRGSLSLHRAKASRSLQHPKFDHNKSSGLSHGGETSARPRLQPRTRRQVVTLAFRKTAEPSKTLCPERSMKAFFVPSLSFFEAVDDFVAVKASGLNKT